MNDQVTSLDQLVRLAQEKRSVTAKWPPPFQKPKPAAFVISMQATMVHRMIESGMYVYEPKAWEDDTFSDIT